MSKLPDGTTIDRPTLPPFHPGRLRECQDALAGAVTSVIDNAEAAGWTLAEITIAIAALADEVMLHEVDVETTNFLLSKVIQQRGQG